MQNKLVYILLTHISEGKLQLKEETIQSFNNQDNKNYKVILIVNNWVDETSEFECSDIDNLETVLTCDESVGAARNIGIEYALSHYDDNTWIYHFDGDDILLPNATSVILDYLKDPGPIAATNFYNYSMARGEYCYKFDQGDSLRKCFRFNWWLIKLSEYRDKHLRFIQDERSFDDYCLGMKLSLIYEFVDFISIPTSRYSISDYKENRSHNSLKRPYSWRLMRYLEDLIDIKVKRCI